MPTFVDLLRRMAETRPADRAFLFVTDEFLAAEPVTYAELDIAARSVAAALTGHDAFGRPVLLVCPPGRSYVVGFLGCLYAGAIAVPAYPPEMVRRNRLRALVADCGARLAVGVPSTKAIDELGELVWVNVDEVPPVQDWTPPAVDGSSLAFLQYTSGSTGSPRGVQVSHANLIHNAGLVQAGLGTSGASIGVSWLPPYHDMGLIGGVLQPLYGGFPTVLMTPATFARRPLSWLRAIETHGGTVSGGPNFAYDLCVRTTTPAERASLDLSGWEVAFCGAEPVRAETLDRFAEAFAPAGFRREAFYSCYGLAEATLIVSGARSPRRLATGHVSCGRPLGGQRVRVVDPGTGRPCAPGVPGEIWLAGPSVTRGYWGLDAAESFRARIAGDTERYLRTGDLGYLDAGELVVTGRLKDLIIVRGRNLHPEDIEQGVAERVVGLRPGGIAAVGIEHAGAERVALACELASPRQDAGEVVDAIRRAVAESSAVAVAAVVLLRPGRLPRTISGKVRRHACRDAVRDEWKVGAPGVVARWDDDEPDRPPALDGPEVGAPTADTNSPDTGAADPGPRVPDLVTRVLGRPAAALPADAALTGLGLDSMRALELQGLLQVHYGLAVAPSELLSGITTADLTARAADAHMDTSPHTDAPPADGQRALWWLQRLAPDSTAYQISRAARIRSPLDVDALDRALRAVVDRHPALRTRLPARDGRPVPEVVAWSGPVLTRHDVTGLAEPELRARVQEAADRPFDLDRGPLFRAELYTIGPADHVLLLSLHHTITDFWSLSVLVGELVSEYHGDPVPPTTTPRRDDDPADLPIRLRYWRDTLAGAPPALDLPTSHPRPRLQSFRGDSHQFRLDGDVLRAVDEFARAEGLTRFAVLTAAVAAVLARYAGTDDLVLGAPTAGRGGGDHDRLGYFVNPVPLRIRVPASDGLPQLAKRVRRAVLDALDHAVPFPRLVEHLHPARDPARSPVFQVMVVVQQPPTGRPDLGAFAVADERARLRVGGLDVGPYRLAEHGAGFDLAVTFADVDGGLTGVVNYCTDLYDRPAVARLAGHVGTLLTRALSTPDTPLSRHSLLDEGERSAVLALAAGPARPFPDRTTLHSLFAAVAAEHPDATAVVLGTKTLSYRELSDRVARLAGVLVNRGVRTGDLIGVCLPRSPDAVLAFWAALASGGCYLPLPADLPPRRLAWLVGDARPAVLLTHRYLADRLPAEGPPRIWLDEPWPVTDSIRVGDRGGPDDLACALYTSGSTGRPKATLLAHRGLCNLADFQIADMALTPASRMLQFSSHAYDVHVAEMLDAHLCGAALHLIPPEAALPGRPLIDLIRRQRITHMYGSPSALAALPDADLPDLSHVVSGGEALSAEVMARWATGRWFANAYGPAETTVCATWGRCDPDGRRPPIGWPLPNVRVYLLDERREPVPVGVPGEIYIGGVGVGRGYLNRPELTAERFLPDPHAGPDHLMYRTGDRARWLPDGRVEFLGRYDDQVKIRGIRIEPGEIEARLRELLGIREVAVVARPGPAGTDELVAYLVAPEPRPVAELRAALRAELPAAWVPAAYVHLDALPLNPAGKLDRRALPSPTGADRGVAAPVPPRTDLERTIADVWAEILHQPGVGVHDHFFDELGGSSLVVTTVIEELGRRLRRPLPVTALFEHPTVAALARSLTEPAPDGPDPDEQAARRISALARRAGVVHEGG